MNRRTVLVSVLVPLLGISATVGYMQMPRQKKVEALKYAPGMISPSPNRQQQQATEMLRVHLELLNSEVPETSGMKRNLFSQPGGLGPGHAGAGTVANSMLPPTSPVVPPPPPPPTPLEIMKRTVSAYRFVGITIIDGVRTAFFSKGDETFPVRAGGRMAGRYEVVSLTDTSLTIRTSDTGELLNLPLLDAARPVIAVQRRHSR